MGMDLLLGVSICVNPARRPQVNAGLYLSRFTGN
jgi:hypothetical protein